MDRTAAIAAFLLASVATPAGAQGFYQQLYGEPPAPEQVTARLKEKTLYPAIYEQVMRDAADLAATAVHRPAVIEVTDYPVIYRRLMER